ncbi:hypothetical protein CKJ84_00800 [Corynebacterium sp. NML 120412]|nr:hypothetical protein CKJ84_00800 [Corynebacterium sp. NML 120412]
MVILDAQFIESCGTRLLVLRPITWVLKGVNLLESGAEGGKLSFCVLDSDTRPPLDPRLAETLDLSGYLFGSNVLCFQDTAGCWFVAPVSGNDTVTY